MYATLGRRPPPAPGTGGELAPRQGHRPVARVVLTLGMVSLLTDLSSEMVVSVLPVYLTLVLGLTPVQYGIVDGLYQGVTAGVRIAGGLVADLTRRPKLVAVAGYGLSCVCKLLFLPAASFAAITGIVAVDRAGKGLRTGPRDAMIAASSEPAALGRAFGVHRAMDTAGALAGPLLAVGVLAWLVDGYDLIFVLSFGLAAVGVAVLVLFVPADRPRPAVPAPVPVQRTSAATVAGEAACGSARRTLAEVRGLVRARTYRRLLLVGGLLSCGTISDGFVYLVLRDRVGIGASVFPLLFVGTAGVYLLLAVPLGRLADRVGRVRVFLGGHLVAALGYLALWLLPPGPGLVAAVLALVGSYYAATDGVLPALTAPVVPEGARASGIAGVQTVMAVGAMLSAAGFGLVWSRWGQPVAVGTFTLALLAGVAAAAVLLRREPAP